ncbi:MAG: ribulokinase [Actinobacteria bacterium]|nr:MAG: ribulokinase [Actinomycetota bacterium]RIK07143.1 MAG: ribulokinase [Acidobacteriota bacterium]
MAGEESFLGLDFGTDSVRALVVDRRGNVRGSAVAPYRHGQIVAGSAAAGRLFPEGLPPDFALQDPDDWLTSAVTAVRRACAGAGGDTLAGIGVDFTSCTVVPALSDGTPLARTGPQMAERPHAWPKLWKHHGAGEQAQRLQDLARQRAEPWLSRYGGAVGLEWFFPKILEVIERDPAVAAATEVWVEGGDWIVWQLTGAGAAGGGQPVRSTCQAGYKAFWSRAEGFPSSEYFGACHPSLLEVVAQKLPGPFLAPGQEAGTLAEAMAERLGLRPGIPVSTAVIDAHAGVPGAGVAESGTLVMVLGTSGCHMLMDSRERRIPGVAGVVADGIMPGLYGYETGQASLGDSFEWVRRMCGQRDFGDLERSAAGVPIGAEGMTVVDWFNGCRTPLMDGALTGAVLGARLHHGQAHLYRAVMEAAACGLRWVVETLIAGGLGISRFVATGGLAHASPLFLEVTAALLGSPVEVHPGRQGPALGAAVLGAVAAGSFPQQREAIGSMAGSTGDRPANRVIEPAPDEARAYEAVYRRYRALADELGTHNQANPEPDKGADG